MSGKLKQLARFVCSLGGCVLAQESHFGVDFAWDWERAKTRFTWSVKLGFYGLISFFGARMFVDIFSPFLTTGTIHWALITCAAGMLLCAGWLGIVGVIRIGIPAVNSNAFVAPNHGIPPTSSRFRAFICKLPGCYTCMNIERMKALRENRKP